MPRLAGVVAVGHPHHATHTSRLCGETGFVRMLKRKVGRRLRPRRRGPKPKQGEEEGQLDLLDGG